MSDLTATNCGSGCNGSGLGSGNGCCNLIFLILLLTCCGGNSFLGGDDCGCNSGCGSFGDNNCLWILLLLFCCGNC